MRMKPIEDYRAFYARFVVSHAGSSSERLIAAFACVARERFLGEGPWPVFVGSGYIPSPDDDPRVLYQDILIGIIPARGINNGQPGLHALCLAACEPLPGETVVHIGAGTGYYTAILAALVGTEGKVIAYEIDPDLADRARVNLEYLSMVQVVAESAAGVALPPADVIYVSAGATHPLATWLDAMKVGGRLIFPLTPNEGMGCMLLVKRKPHGAYAATIVTRAGFVHCIGARNDADALAVKLALETRSPMAVKSLRRDFPVDDSAWCIGEDWWLSTADPA
jgi:protein-L-isoaspartate(D-aspartate) O-methyltransferase